MLNGIIAKLCPMRKNFRDGLPRGLVLVLLYAVLATFSTTARAQQGTFVPTQNFIVGGPTATRLQNGMVLTKGYDLGIGAYAAALFDPATSMFTPTGGSTVPAGSTATTATLLNNGMVLFAAGNGFNAELYDPTTGTFTATGDMALPQVIPRRRYSRKESFWLREGGHAFNSASQRALSCTTPRRGPSPLPEA